MHKDTRRGAEASWWQSAWQNRVTLVAILLVIVLLVVGRLIN